MTFAARHLAWMLGVIAIAAGLGVRVELYADEPAKAEPEKAEPTKEWVELEAESLLATGGESPARQPSLASSAERQLAQADALIEAKAYDEALTALDELLAADDPGLAEVAPGQFATLRELCHARIALAPAELRAVYRQRVDSTAEALWSEATARNDTTILRRIVSEYFCSSRGDDALLLLGELALERGDYDTARRYWLRIDLRLTDAAGRSWGLVATADQITARAEEFRQQVVHPALPTQVAYPDSDQPIGTVLARLAVASLRAGQLPRAATEIAMIEVLSPLTRGRLGGREVDLLPALREMLTTAATWPVPHSTSTTTVPLMNDEATAIGPLTGVMWTDVAPRKDSSEPVLASGGIAVPVVRSGMVIYYSDSALRARDVATGAPAITDSGQLYREALVASAVQGRIAIQNRLQIQNFGNAAVLRGRVAVNINPFLFGGQPVRQTPALPLVMNVSLRDNVAFALLGSRAAANAEDPTPRLRSGPRRLLGLDLDRDGLVAWEAELPDGSLEPSGPALPLGDSVVLPLRDLAQGQAMLASFEARTGRLRWQTTIAHITPTLTQQSPDHDLVRAAGETLFLDTGDGLLVALEAATGKQIWTFSYPLGESDRPNNLATVRGRTVPEACLVADGLVLIAPRRGTSVMAVDAATGRLVWQNDEAWDVDALLGVRGGRLVATGQRLWIFDVLTGKPLLLWPESTQAGVAGNGVGCLAGGEAFWPTRQGIIVFDIASASRSRTNIALPDAALRREVVLTPAGELLLVSSEQGLTVLGPAATVAATPPGENLQ